MTNTDFEVDKFSIRIDDPDFRFLGYNELTPVTSSEEWKFLMEAEE